MSAFRTVWAALVGLYEETLVLLVGNVAALALNLPIGLVVFVLITLASIFFGLPIVGTGEDASPSWLLVAIAWLMALIANVLFYASVGGWLRFASILWLYGTLFWLSLHIYLAPLVVHVAEPSLLNLYKRAAFIALGHAGYSMLLLVVMLVVGFIAVVFLPAYVLIGAAFISLVQAHALREIRRRHGDLDVEPEEVGSL